MLPRIEFILHNSYVTNLRSIYHPERRDYDVAKWGSKQALEKRKTSLSLMEVFNIALIYPRITSDRTTNLYLESSHLHQIWLLIVNYLPGLYDKKNFNVAILNCPYFDSNTPSAVAYRVHTSQFIRYDRAFTKDGNLNFGSWLLPMTLCTYRED